MMRHASRGTGGEGRTERASLWRDEEGATTIEYALLLALIVASCVFAYQRLGLVTAESVNQGGIPAPNPPTDGGSNAGVAGPSQR
jgi:pilus assembly protein Flp/PilA